MPRKKIHENGWNNTPEGAAYHYRYTEEHYGRLYVRIPKARKNEVDKLAADAGVSVAKFVLEAVDAWKQLHGIE